MYRTFLVQNDPARNTSIFGTTARDLYGASFQLLNETTGQFFTLLPEAPPYIRDPNPESEQLVRFPQEAPVGVYSFLVNGLMRWHGLHYEIKPPARGTPVTLAAGSSADEFEAAMAASSEVTLSAGSYHFTRAVFWPPNTNVYIYGAHIWRIPNGDYGERMFVPGHNCSLSGGTLHPAYMVWHANPVVAGLCVRDTVQVGGALGWGMEECNFFHCVFDGAGALYAPTGLYQLCEFVNTWGGLHAFMMTAARPGAFAMIDCTFRYTDRGPVMNLNGGSITGGLFHGILCADLVRGVNGNEIFMCEGGTPAGYEFSDNLINRLRVVRCSSGVMQLYDSNARRNVAWDLEVDGNCILWFSGNAGAEVCNNYVGNFELRNGARIFCGCYDGAGNITSGRVHDNLFSFGAIVNYHVGRQNQDSWGSMYLPVALASATFRDLNNKLDGVSIVGLGPGCVAVDGLQTRAVVVDNVPLKDTFS